MANEYFFWIMHPTEALIGVKLNLTWCGMFDTMCSNLEDEECVGLVMYRDNNISVVHSKYSVNEVLDNNMNVIKVDPLFRRSAFGWITIRLEWVEPNANGFWKISPPTYGPNSIVFRAGSSAVNSFLSNAKLLMRDPIISAFEDTTFVNSKLITNGRLSVRNPTKLLLFSLSIVLFIHQIFASIAKPSKSES
eukprot:124316_1